MTQASLFAERTAVASVAPWKPHALTHDQWPPNYAGVYAWRLKTLTALRADPDMMRDARAYYAANKGEFIQHWVDTYNPRKAKGAKWVPFVFFAKQQQFLEFVEELDRDQENGLVEKCRDIGATWLAAAYSVACWLFDDDDATGWGSRKQDLVDKLGNADSIFEKMRLILKRLPPEWLPDGFKWRDHATFMKLINPANGSTVTGEAGDNIGRGGRNSRYFKDESAWWPRPELAEAALGDNTNVQIDISSVAGPNNVFYRRRKNGVDWYKGRKFEPGEVRVFVFAWDDHPEKTQEWYDARKAKAEREGLLHVFAQEVDRDYFGTATDRIIEPEWIDACVDAHMKVPYLSIIQPFNVWSMGLDLADGGTDRNAQAEVQWIILRDVEEWGERDPGVTARRCMKRALTHPGVKVQYDSIGIGSNVKSEYNRLRDTGEIKPGSFHMVPWNAGAAVVNPFDTIIPDDDESPLNRDFYHNMKAQAWWSLRARCYKTYRAVKFGDVYKPEELVSFDSKMLLLEQLKGELAQATRGDAGSLKMLVNKTPEGTKSPNLADAVVMAYFPAPEASAPTTGSMSG